MESDSALSGGTFPQRCGESFSRVQNELPSIVAATEFSPGGAFNELVEDVLPDRFRPPFAFTVQHRSIKECARDIYIEVRLPDPAYFLRRRSEALLGVLPRMVSAHLFKHPPHVFIEVRCDSMAPDVPAEALHYAGQIRLHEAIPECNQWICDEVTSVPLPRAGVRRADDTNQPHPF